MKTLILGAVSLLILPLLAAAPSEQDRPYSESGTAIGASAPADPSNVPGSDATPSEEAEEVPNFIYDEEALRKQRAQPDTNQADPADEDLPTETIIVEPESPSTQSPSTSSLVTEVFEGFTSNSVVDSTHSPPDPNIAATPSDLVLTVNRSWGIFSKSGVNEFKTSFKNWFLDLIPDPDNTTLVDPRAIFDPSTNRTVFSVLGYNESTDESAIYFAVSDTDNPHDTWCNFRFDANVGSSSTGLADQPALGIDSDGIYITSTVRVSGTDFQTNLYIIRQDEYTDPCGSRFRYNYFTDLRNEDDTQAIHVRPALMLDEPSDGIAYMVNGHVPVTDYPNGDAFTFWTVDVTADDIVLEKEEVDTPDYVAPSTAPQPNGVQLDTHDGKLINAVYSDGRLFTSHTVDSEFGDPDTSAVRYYEIEPEVCTLLIFCGPEVQRTTEIHGAEGTGLYIFNPAVASQRNGDQIVTFNTSSTEDFPDGRVVQNVNGEWEVVDIYKSGDGSSDIEQWGDYAGAARDTDGTTLWVYNEVGPASDEVWTTWGARID